MPPPTTLKALDAVVELPIVTGPLNVADALASNPELVEKVRFALDVPVLIPVKMSNPCAVPVALKEPEPLPPEQAANV